MPLPMNVLVFTLKLAWRIDIREKTRMIRKGYVPEEVLNHSNGKEIELQILRIYKGHAIAETATVRMLVFKA